MSRLTKSTMMNSYKLTTEHGASERVKASSAQQAGDDFRAAMPGVKLLRIQLVRLA